MRWIFTLFFIASFLYMVNVYFSCFSKVAPWKGKEIHINFWIEPWKDKFALGVISIVFAVLSPFAFFFYFVYGYIPNGEYRIRVDVNGYELPCDLTVMTGETESLNRDGSIGISYSKDYYLYMAYWPNGGQLKIDEYISPEGDELEVKNDGRLYTIKTPQITQEFLGLNLCELTKERILSGIGIWFLVLEIAAVYMAIQFICVMSNVRPVTRRNEKMKH